MNAYQVHLDLIKCRALRKFAIAGGHGRASNVLSHSEAANFPGLRHWGFIERRGKCTWEWVITKRGYDFLDKLICVPRTAIVYEGKLVKFDGDDTYYNLEPCRIWHRNDYAENQVQLDHGQSLLFGGVA